MKDNKQQDNSANPIEDIELDNQVEETVDHIEELVDELTAEGVEDEQKIQELSKQLEESNAALEKEKKEYLFLLADFDNFRKRVAKEKVELVKNGGEKVLSALLPIIDDFERGLEATKDVDNAQAIREGMELIYQKFVKFLDDNGVKEIPAEAGADFDTDHHEAIATIPAPAPELKGKIIDTTQKGYTLNGTKVLRHAKVVVGE